MAPAPTVVAIRSSRVLQSQPAQKQSALGDKEIQFARGPRRKENPRRDAHHARHDATLREAARYTLTQSPSCLSGSDVHRRATLSQKKRLWCDRLPCGHIVAELPDGTLLLCVRKRRHKCDCFNPDQNLLRVTQAREVISGASIPCGGEVTVSQLAQVSSRSNVLPSSASLVPILEGRVNE